jgi:hypothetical protein
MNGRLMATIKPASGRLSTFDSSIDTPVAPPSMKRLDKRNPCKPIPAERMPTMINKAFLNSRLAFFIA